MDLDSKRKKYVKIDQSTESDHIFALLDEVTSDFEDDIDDLMNHSDTEFILEKDTPENNQQQKRFIP